MDTKMQKPFGGNDLHDALATRGIRNCPLAPLKAAGRAAAASIRAGVCCCGPIVGGRRPTAYSLSDLVTTTQLTMIRRLAKAHRLKADTECDQLFGCEVGELSRHCAAALIRKLETGSSKKAPLRSAGRATGHSRRRTGLSCE